MTSVHRNGAQDVKKSTISRWETSGEANAIFASVSFFSKRYFLDRSIHGTITIKVVCLCLSERSSVYHYRLFSLGAESRKKGYAKHFGYKLATGLHLKKNEF